MGDRIAAAAASVQQGLQNKLAREIAASEIRRNDAETMLTTAQAHTIASAATQSWRNPNYGNPNKPLTNEDGSRTYKAGEDEITKTGLPNSVVEDEFGEAPGFLESLRNLPEYLRERYPAFMRFLNGPRKLPTEDQWQDLYREYERMQKDPKVRTKPAGSRARRNTRN